MDLLQLAKSCGAVDYTPPPMRAIRGLSFTYEQLEDFLQKVIEENTPPKEAPSEASRGPKNWLTEAREANEHILASRAEVADVRQLQAVARAAWEFVNCATNLDDDSLNPLRKALAAALPPAAPGTPGGGR